MSHLGRQTGSPSARASANRGSSRTCCSNDSPGDTQSLDPLKQNKSFFSTIENESLISGVVTNQVHPSRLFSGNYRVPSVVDAFQSLNSVHLLLGGECGIFLATVHSVIKSDMSRIHGSAEKRYLVLVSRVYGIGLGLVNCEGIPAKGRSCMKNAARLYLRLVGTGSDHPRWAQT